MTNMIISCPSCPQKLRVPEELLGRPVKCPKCGIIFDAPHPAVSGEPAQETVEIAGSSAPLSMPSAGGPGTSGPAFPRTSRIRRDAEPGRGALILTLGIISIVLPVIGWIPGIAAIVMGRSDQQKIRAGSMDRSAADTTQAGWICGIIGTVIQLLVCVGCGLYISLMVLMFQQVRSGKFAPPPAVRVGPGGAVPMQPMPAPAPGGP